jgi:hypothetical protein
MVAKPSGRRSTAVEACDITLADLAPDRVVGVERPPSKIERATDYLKTALADGDWHPAGPILVELRRRELGGDSVVREARARAGVGHRKCRGVKDGPSEWQLATPSGEPRAMTPSTVPRAGGSIREYAFEFDGRNPNGTANLSTRQEGDTHPESRRRCSSAEELDASGENSIGQEMTLLSQRRCSSPKSAIGASTRQPPRSAGESLRQLNVRRSETTWLVRDSVAYGRGGLRDARGAAVVDPAGGQVGSYTGCQARAVRAV